MAITASTRHRLRVLFLESFSAADIAEPLASFDAGASASEVRAVMERCRYKVAGIRRDGRIQGYVRCEQLGDATCGECMSPFAEGEVVPASTGLPDLVMLLRDRPWIFVTVLGQVGGIVTKTDFEKPPVRMWLFGMITIIEMSLTQLIEEAYPDGQWRDCLPEGRLQKAETLLQERQRRSQSLDLLDCLQFSDRGQIVLRNEGLRTKAGFVSRTRGEQTVKELEALRNNLAHSQDIVACDWDTIVKMAENLDKVLGPPG